MLVLVRFLNVLKKISYAHQSNIYLFKNTVKTIILWNIIEMKNNSFLFEYILNCNLFLWCKDEFSASLLQASVSHDPLKIIQIYRFAAQEKTVVLHHKLLNSNTYIHAMIL